MGELLFSDAEYAARLAAVRRRMAENDAAVLLLSAPENIFYLCGLDHWGYFAPHLLIVPAEGDLVLATPALAALREAQPGAQIDLLAQPMAAGLVRGTGLVDHHLRVPREALDRYMEARLYAGEEPIRVESDVPKHTRRASR